MKRLDQQKNPETGGGCKGQPECSEPVPHHQKVVHANGHRNRGKTGHCAAPGPVFHGKEGGKLLPPKQRKYTRDLTEDILIEQATRLRVAGSTAGKAGHGIYHQKEHGHSGKEAGSEHADRKKPAVLFHLIVPEELAADDLRTAHEEHGNRPDQEPDGRIESDGAHCPGADIIAGKKARDDSVDLTDRREENLHRKQAEQEPVDQINIRMRL